MGRIIHGLHYQKASCFEKKLVVCTQSIVWNMAVDLRKLTPTTLQWTAEILPSENLHVLPISRGEGHALPKSVPDTEMLYMHSVPDYPSAEVGISLMDYRLHISWPEPLAAISDRDKSQLPLAETRLGLTS